MNRTRQLLKTAIWQSELPLRKKIFFLGLLSIMREDKLQMLDQQLVSVLGDVSTKVDGEIIRIIIENLDVILEFIIALVGLFG